MEEGGNGKRGGVKERSDTSSANPCGVLLWSHGECKCTVEACRLQANGCSLMAGSSTESLQISLRLSVYFIPRRSRPVSRAVSGSWRLFTFRQPLLPVQTCCVSYSICSKFTGLYFLTSHFLYLLLLSRSPHKHLSCLSPVLWSACWPLCSPKGNMHEGSRKEGNWGMRKESEMGLIRRHRVSCQNSERSAGFFSAVRGQTQSSNWERMSRLQTSAVMHGYSSSESALLNYPDVWMIT